MAKNNLYENRLHGDLLFPFQHYTMTTSTCNIFVPYHWHKEIEIILLTKGEVELLLDGEKLLLQEGDIIFVNSRQLHQYTSLTDEVNYYAYVFPMESLKFKDNDITQTSIIEPLLGQELRFPTRLSTSNPCYEKIRDCIAQIIRANEQQDECYQLLTKAYLYEIIGLLSQNGLLTRELTAYKELGTYRKILRYIEEHYQERITVPAISAYLGMSPNYFSAYFTRHFGKNFVEFLIHYRIEKACVLLTTDDCSVTQAALQTGFENISYFIKKFKSVTGVTPATYKKVTFLASKLSSD